MSKVELGEFCLSIFLLLGSETGIGVQIVTRRYWKSGILVEIGDLYKVYRRASVSVKGPECLQEVLWGHSSFSCLLH